MARYSTPTLMDPPVFKNKVVMGNTGTFTTPPGVTCIRASAMGPGGQPTCGSTTGGAGGGFAQKVFSTRPGCSYCVVVGCPPSSPTCTGCFSCFPGICATGGTTSPGCGFGGDINNIGGCGGEGVSVSGKSGCTCSFGGGGSGAGMSGNGIKGLSGTQFATSCLCNCWMSGAGAPGTGGAKGAYFNMGFISCASPYAPNKQEFAEIPSADQVGLESGGAGAGAQPGCITSSSVNVIRAGHGSGAGAHFCFTASCVAGTGLVAIEY